MARFEMREGAGDHTAGVGKDLTKHEAGEVIESDLPLDKLFKNKFTPLDRPLKAPRDRDNRLDQSAGRQLDADDAVRRQNAKAAAARPTDDKPIAQRPTRDFNVEEEPDEEDDAVVRGVNEEELKPKGRKGQKPQAAEGEPEGESKFGDDVTDEVDGAEEAGFRVFHDSSTRKYTVVKADRPAKAVNAEEITTKRDLKKFVKENAPEPAEGEGEEGGDED